MGGSATRGPERPVTTGDATRRAGRRGEVTATRRDGTRERRPPPSALSPSPLSARRRPSPAVPAAAVRRRVGHGVKVSGAIFARHGAGEGRRWLWRAADTGRVKDGLSRAVSPPPPATAAPPEQTSAVGDGTPRTGKMSASHRPPAGAAPS